MSDCSKDVSDGHHTFRELYEHRYALWISFCAEVNSRCAPGYVWRSRLHSDGTMFDDSFVLGIGTAWGEQMTYHLPMRLWDAVHFIEERTRAPEYDGHSPTDVAERLKRFWL